jgi:hypothetical protein
MLVFTKAEIVTDHEIITDCHRGLGMLGGVPRRIFFRRSALFEKYACRHA